MKIELSKKRQKADLVILPCFEDGKSFVLAADIQFRDNKLLKTILDFKAKLSEIALRYPLQCEDFVEKRVIFLGLGTKSKLTLDDVRTAYATAIRSILQNGIDSVNVYLPHITLFSPSNIVRAVSEGVALGNYSFQKLKSKEKITPIKHMQIIADKAFAPIAKKALAIAKVVHDTRDLVNDNADTVTPFHLEQTAKDIAKSDKRFTLKVLHKKEIEKEKMGLLLAVNRGSSKDTKKDPRLICLFYNGNPASQDRIALIGKGVTYDTGGLSLKPSNSMLDMRMDMGGAATVLGAIKAAAKISLKQNIMAIVPTTENAIGPDSYKVGDVVTSYIGRTVEIDNTDAEGRLILADAAGYCVEKFKPSLIIDVATLTGAIIIALGNNIAGLFSDSPALVEVLKRSSDATGDLVWPMPAFDPYLKLLKSDVADTKNTGSRAAGSITAGLFIRSFIKKSVPWAHLDIAGVAFLPKAFGCNPKNATGAVVRVLVDAMENMTPAFFKALARESK